MSIARTNINLAKFCLEVVGAPYWFGTFGQQANRSLYNSKKSQYPDYYPPRSWTESSFTDDFGKRVTDCAGLIKWFLWSDNMANKSPTYKASEDWGANTMWLKCKERGSIGSLPENKIGILVFKGSNSIKNHVGVIVDNYGTVVEAKGHAYGTIKSKAKDWGYWGKFDLITYEDAPVPTKDTYTVSTNGDALRLRKEPTTKSEQVGYIDNGTTITSKVVVKGEDIGGCNAWVQYNGGYASGKYLTPTPEIKPEPKKVTIELPVLELGSEGGEVLTIQALLNEIGFKGANGKRLVYDGIFGENVKYALTNYQKARNLPVTGICDYDTWNRILK